MAKLFIGCDYIDFSYADADYRGVISKIILDEKTIYRVDYTSMEDSRSGRFEASCAKDNVSDSLSWTPHSNTSPDLAIIIQKVIQKNQFVMQLEN
jgi:hypothetical protein